MHARGDSRDKKRGDSEETDGRGSSIWGNCTVKFGFQRYKLWYSAVSTVKGGAQEHTFLLWKDILLLLIQTPQI